MSNAADLNAIKQFP